MNRFVPGSTPLVTTAWLLLALVVKRMKMSDDALVFIIQ
jgi:hypothetical protein